MFTKYFNRLFISLVLCVVSKQLYSQQEFLVTINPSTGNHSVVGDIDDVRWIHVFPRYSTFDETNHHYIFAGQDVDHVNYLYTIDADDATTVHRAFFPILSDPSDNVVELQFDNELQKLFGLHWDNSELREYFVSINQVTGEHTIINDIPELEGIFGGTISYDQQNHHYMFRGQNNDGSIRNYVISAIDGTIVSATIDTGTVTPLFNCYDNSLNQMFALYWNDTTQTEYLVKLNHFTGELEHVCSIPGLRYLTFMPQYVTYNSNNHQMIFMGLDSNMVQHLYSVDTQLGQVVSSPTFPVLEDVNDNVIEIVYDNLSNKLFALHWNNSIVNVNYSGVYIYPNPCVGQCTLELNNEYSFTEVQVFDANGKKIKRLEKHNTTEVTIPVIELARGHYFVRVIADNIDLGVQKIMVE